MDLLYEIIDSVRDFISDLNINIHIFVIRMGLWLALTNTALAYVWQYIKDTSSHIIQVCIMFATLIIMYILDVEEMLDMMTSDINVILFIFFFLCMVFIPSILPFWTTPKYGHQKILRRILYISVWGLFFIQLIIA